MINYIFSSCNQKKNDKLQDDIYMSFQPQIMHFNHNKLGMFSPNHTSDQHFKNEQNGVLFLNIDSTIEHGLSIKLYPKNGLGLIA